MRPMLPLLALTLLASTIGAPARAAFIVDFGQSWDGPQNTLQKILDAHYGVGQIDVTTDYIGHNASDPDPFFWADHSFGALIITEVAGNANRNVVGWYKEIGSMPVIDGVDDAVVFNGPAGAGASRVVTLPGGTENFGFYMNPNGPLDATNAPEPEKFFTNRQFNDLGPDGSGAIHEPFDGDVQALVYDISRFRGPNTWLVCFEDLDSGANPGPCCETTDNDFNDFVFEVTAVGATPVVPMTFGRLKLRYR